MEFYKLESSIKVNKSQNYDNESQSAGNTVSRTSETLCLQSIEYIAGVIDGDGNFDVRSINGVSKLKAIRVKLHIRDIRIVIRLQSLLHCGKLRYNKHLVSWTVSRLSDTHRIIRLLNGHIRLKVSQFNKACECLDIIPQVANTKVTPQSRYLYGLIDTDGTVVFNYHSNRVELHLELKQTIYSEKLDLTCAIPGASVRVLPLIKRNQTRHKNFYSIRYSFDTVENMIHIYNFVMKYRLYSDFKFFRVSQIPMFLKIRHFKNEPFNSIEHRIYSQWVLRFIKYLNPGYTKVSYYDKLSRQTHYLESST